MTHHHAAPHDDERPREVLHLANSTNLLLTHREPLHLIAAEAGAEVVLWVMDVPLEVCIARDAARPSEEEVIRWLSNRS